MKDGKLTVIGKVDPVNVVGKVRKSGWHAELLTVGPAKEEKKEEPKKEEAKKNSNIPNDQLPFCNSHYNPNMPQYYYHVPSAEDNPNACVIC